MENHQFLVGLPLKAPFIGDFQLPCLVTRGYLDRILQDLLNWQCFDSTAVAAWISNHRGILFHQRVARRLKCFHGLIVYARVEHQGAVVDGFCSEHMFEGRPTLDKHGAGQWMPMFKSEEFYTHMNTHENMYVWLYICITMHHYASLCIIYSCIRYVCRHI